MFAGYNMNISEAKTWIEIDKKEERHSFNDGRIEEVLKFIENNYVDSLEMGEIEVHMLQEVVTELDPHSSYITAEQLSDHQGSIQGKYDGIGIETELQGDTFYIMKVLEDSPAMEVGLTVGTQILLVDGDTVSGVGLSVNELKRKLKNPDNESLSLTLRALGNSEQEILEIEPREIIIKSTEAAYVIEKNTIFLRINRFSSNTYEQFVEALDKLTDPSKKMDIIVDLRDNPGGELSEAIKVLSQFFAESDKLLTYTEGLNRKKAKYHSTGKSFFGFEKIVVLIDNNSASASEIIAGAIQDWDKGLVIGSPSYGKGLVQEIFPLKNGGALKLTVAKYFTPSGRCIQRGYKGLTTEHVSDASTQKTMVLGRAMDNGSGIEPDIAVDEKLSECRVNDYILEAYVLYLMRKAQGTELMRKDMDLADFQPLLDEMNIDDVDYDYSSCQSHLQKSLFLKYKELTLDKKDYYRFKNVDDPYIKLALDFINDKRPTLALLSDKK